jgi:hypothetical protein
MISDKILRCFVKNPRSARIRNLGFFDFRAHETKNLSLEPLLKLATIIDGTINFRNIF